MLPFVVSIFVGILLIFIIIYFLLEPKRHTQRLVPELGYKFFAHRGLHSIEDGIPENSIAAIKRAVEHGYGIEFDVQLTKDKVPVVFHDFDLERMCGVKAKVDQLSLEELKTYTLASSDEHIPTLKEVLDTVDGKVPLLVELKVEVLDISVCAKADELLQAYSGNYIIESFHPLALRWYKKNRAEILRGQLSSNLIKEKAGNIFACFFAKYLLLNFLGRPDFVSYNCLYSSNVARIICRHFFGNISAAWTVKSENQLEEIEKKYDWYIFEQFIPYENVQKVDIYK